MPKKPKTKRQVLGALAGSAATRVAIKPYLFKWFTHETYLEQTGSIVNDLVCALEDKDEPLGRALVDHGGPFWSETYDDFFRLSGDDQTWVLHRLRPAVMTAARALMDCAQEEHWTGLLTEAIDAAGWLMGELITDKKDTPRRADVMVQRPWRRGGTLPCLIVDLKYHERFNRSDIEADLAATVRAYGLPYARAFGQPVACCILAYNETGDFRWSREDPGEAPTGRRSA